MMFFRRLVMRMAGILLGGNPKVPADYRYLATDTSGRLYGIPVGNLNTAFLQDAANRLQVLPVGSTSLPLLQDAGNRLVTAPVGSGANPFLQDAANRLQVLPVGLDVSATARGLRVDTAGRVTPTMPPYKRLVAGDASGAGLTYACPGGTQAMVTEILICNGNGATQTITVVAAGVTILSAFALPTAQFVRIPLSLGLDPTDVLALVASAANVFVYVSGVEVT